ncbi:MAG: hypothetical protein KKB22_07195 [Candidatus Omnitrophica bacterium]|nr:hypothetical protein [Candidatus Omnitrophota bacterium]
MKKTRNKPPERVPSAKTINNKNNLIIVHKRFSWIKIITVRIIKNVTINSELTFLDNPTAPG